VRFQLRETIGKENKNQGRTGKKLKLKKKKERDGS
jgi:hypothetical protein